MSKDAAMVTRQPQTPDETTSQPRGYERALPLVDVLENDDEILILADMPGVAAHGVDVRLERSELSISGRQAVPDGAEPAWRPLEFARAFTVPDSVEAERVSAELHGGVLHLRLGKGDHAKPKRIQVTSG